MPPAWLTALAWTALAVAFASTAWIAYDIYRRRYRLWGARTAPTASELQFFWMRQ